MCCDDRDDVRGNAVTDRREDVSISCGSSNTGWTRCVGMTNCPAGRMKDQYDDSLVLVTCGLLGK